MFTLVGKQKIFMEISFNVSSKAIEYKIIIEGRNCVNFTHFKKAEIIPTETKAPKK